MTSDGESPAASEAPAPPSASPWLVERVSGSAAGLLDRGLPDPPTRTVWINDVTAAALVLGSTQPFEIVDHNATATAGIEVARRGSGGGAVLVEPGALVWIDVVVPAGDPLADDDVARASHWLGQTWDEALRACGLTDVEVHRGALVTTPWSPLICFAGLGPGEVSVGGRKVVGLSQRRTRLGARFSTAALLRWKPARTVSLLLLGPAERDGAVADLASRAAPLEVDSDALAGAFLAALPGGVIEVAFRDPTDRIPDMP